VFFAKFFAIVKKFVFANLKEQKSTKYDNLRQTVNSKNPNFFKFVQKMFEIWQFPDSEWVGLTFFLKTAFIQTVRKIDKNLDFLNFIKIFC